MKIHYKSLLLAAMVCSSGISQAYSNTYLHDPYVGVSIIQTNQRFTSDFSGNKLFAHNPQDYAIMAGFRFWCFLGVEAGYEFQPVNNEQYYFLPGQTDQTGTVVIATETVAVESSYRTIDPYLGLTATYDTNFKIGAGKLRTEALIGLSASKVTANSQVHVVNDLVHDYTTKSYSKSLVVPIARIAAYADLTRFVSLGLSLQYRNMGRFTLISTPVAGTTTYTIKMQDMFGIGLGLRLYFPTC